MRARCEGGPGYPSIDSAEGYLFMLGPLRRRHDMIVVDNRGLAPRGLDGDAGAARRGDRLSAAKAGAPQGAPAPRFVR